MYVLKYSEKADDDLTSIYNYIARDSVDRAVTYLGKIEQAILRLREYPEIGHVCRYEELAYLGMRILPYDDYLIFYMIDVDTRTINIIRVLHGAMNYVQLFTK